METVKEKVPMTRVPKAEWERLKRIENVCYKMLYTNIADAGEAMRLLNIAISTLPDATNEEMRSAREHRMAADEILKGKRETY